MAQAPRNASVPAAAPPNPPARGERSPGVKLVIAVFIAVALMVPLLMVYGLLWDRQQQAETAQASIGQGWGGQQTIAGPVIVIPYRATETQTVTENGRDVTRSVNMIRNLYLSPQSNTAEVTIKPEKRKKAIYETVVYESQIAGSAEFVLPADIARYGVTRDALMLDRAEVRLGVSDARGLVDGNSLSIDGTPLALQPGKGLLSTGNSGTFAFVDWSAAAPMKVDYRVGVRGLGDFKLIPRGVDTRWTVKSSWPNPSFGGDFLPAKRNVTGSGFTATYAIPNLALGQAQVLTGDLSPPVTTNYGGRGYMEPVPVEVAVAADTAAEASGGTAKAVAISLIEPVDLYSQVDRSIKYGFLFIGFTFVAFLMFDIIAGARVAAAEYLLTGVALVLFFVLLLAFAEVIGFTPAYLLASAAIIGLLAAYSAAVLKSWKRARFLAAMLIGLYALLYVLLNLEAYSLLIGSVLMFFALAGVMYMTRNIDWGGLGKKEEPVAA
ncbi:cell envelope integrity protein CreD [Sphingopyxis macrogoltabida]|uniref:Colicin resistance protein n=1 Tax=Sphingopyxis macrogoltabida TaxID=33050 RepID=A0A0N9UWA4_SPHMC|nr:cell envelope integrity protein CreD [Sphingopyxis macrogoltabida]ALH79124.1 colicin resistance protein [Sphingopyxis macrogoltabida]